MVRRLILLGTMIVLPVIGISQQLISLARYSGDFKLDGLSDESAWKGIDPLPLTMQSPSYRGAPTERTEIRLAYDDRYLYASGRFYDSDPEGIRGTSLVRDANSPTDDIFAVILDSFNDNENALGFTVAASGNKGDWTVYNDAEMSGTSMPFNESWNTFWDAAVTITSEGWFAEIQIPLSSLRFDDKDGNVTLGVISWRYHPRKNETVMFPDVPPKWDLAMMKPSQAQDMTMVGVKSRNPLYITPYILGGGGFLYDLTDDSLSYTRTDNDQAEVGLDLKYGLTNNLTLDLTLNTDFAQVEADDQQVNLSRFSLFFPEKRLFFQERSSIFDYSIGGPFRLFYSRQIGLSEEDGPVRIYGGARLVGRLGNWDVGFLEMQTAKASDLPSENFGVLRLRRQILNQYSNIGMILTSRVGRDGSYNYVYGVDGLWRAFSDDYLSASFAQSFDDAIVKPGNATFGRISRGRISWERRTNTGLGYDGSMSFTGSDFDPGVGFAPRLDYTSVLGKLSYGWHPGDDWSLQNHVLSVSGMVFRGNTSGKIETVNFGPSWSVNFRSGASAQLTAQYKFERLDEALELSDDLNIPVGSYAFWGMSAFYQSPWGDLLRFGVTTDVGTFYDGTQVSVTLSPVWVVSRYLELSSDLVINSIRFPDRSEVLDANIGRFRAKASLNTRISATSFIQYGSDSKVLTVNFRFRYNPREGNDLYLVYNEGMNTDIFRESPRLPRMNDRTILLKYSYTFLL